MSISKKTRKQCKRKTANGTTMVEEVFALAKKLGWKFVNEKETRLIELLRHTSHEGRTCVMQYAEATRKASPWPTSPFRGEG